MSHQLQSCTHVFAVIEHVVILLCARMRVRMRMRVRVCVRMRVRVRVRVCVLAYACV